MLRISSRSSTWLLAGALLCACGGGPDDPEPDAGTDAAVEPDAGPADAGGDPDGGPSPAIARDDAREQVGAMETARADVPASMQDTSAFLQLDLIATRLDAVIGEKSTSLIEMLGVIGEKSTTLALTEAAVTVLVIAQQLDAAVRDLDAMIAASTWSASGEASLIALEGECVALRDDVDVLRDVMWTRFRELVDLGGIVPRDVPGYLDSRVVDAIVGTAAIDVVVEGRSAADPTATVSADCGDSAPSVRVVDAEAGELVPLTAGTAGTPTVVPVTLGHDVLRVLRVELSIVDVTAWTRCTVVVTGRRQVRGAVETIDTTEQAALAREDGTWSTNGDGLATMLEAARSAGTLDEGRIAAVEQFARDAGTAVSRQRGLSASSSTIEAEDYEIDQLVLERVIVPLADLLIGDLGDPMVTVHIQAWRDAITAMLVESAPGHVGGTL